MRRSRALADQVVRRWSIGGIVLLVCSLAAAAAPASQWAVAVLPSGAEFSLEVAISDEARARGYMYRESVGDNEGMLFVFEEAGLYGFWMKNCRVSLDLIWLDEGFRVVHIAHDRPPCPAEGECPRIAPMQAGRYVLELAAGRARGEGLALGDRLVVLAEPPLP